MAICISKMKKTANSVLKWAILSQLTEYVVINMYVYFCNLETNNLVRICNITVFLFFLGEVQVHMQRTNKEKVMISLILATGLERLITGSIDKKIVKHQLLMPRVNHQ